MKKVLIAYTTKSGSTTEVAEFIGKEIGRLGAQTEVKPIHAAKNLQSYDLIIVGGPMLMGWHPDAKKFLKENQVVLKDKQVACFATARSLTVPNGGAGFSMPICTAPALAKPPKDPNGLSFKENFTTLDHYLKPVLTGAPLVKPATFAFFAGKLDLAKLNIFNRLFVQVVVGAQPGDFRNWDAIRTWTAGLMPAPENAALSARKSAPANAFA